MWKSAVALVGALAVHGCAKSADPNDAEALVSRLAEQQTATAEWRETVDRLVKIGVPSIPHLINGLGSDSLDSYTGCRAGLLRIAESRTQLEEALLDSKRESSVRVASAQILQEIGSPASLEAILKAADDLDPNIRRFATLALASQPDRRAFEFLVERLRDADRYIAGAAASALGMRHDRAATPYMLAALKQRNDNTKYAIVPALGGLRDPAVVPVLLEVIAGTDPQLRVAAVEALGLTGGSEAVAALGKLVADVKSGLAVDAVWALAKRNSPAAKEILIQASGSPDPAIRAAAERSLRQIESAPE
jgi:HEAT repeat protein